MTSLANAWMDTIKKLIAKAESLYQDHQDEEAARLYERAGNLYVKNASKAPSTTLEGVYKNRGLKHLEYARFLRENKGKLKKIAGKSAEIKGNGDSKAPRRAATTPGKIEGSEEETPVSSLLHSSSITFEKIGGLDDTKQEIKYALGVSLAQKPDNIELESWRNWLFYGPPGTGKTLLAAATSNVLKATDSNQAIFFNVKVSSVMSKWFGESSRIISDLYSKARDCSPAVVFLDEFEALCGSRDGEDSGTERRILSTILSELDGLSEKGRDDLFVLTIAATNRPWDLDPAILSRFDKKILIPLPDEKTRLAILKILTVGRGYEIGFPIEDLITLTEGFSGREIESMVKEVVNRMVMGSNKDITTVIDGGLDEVRGYKLKTRKLEMRDFIEAYQNINPVTPKEEMQRYYSWKDGDN